MYAIPEGYGKHVVRAIERGEVYEPETIRYLQGFKRIIHAGACFGDFLPALKSAEIVWAFEPEPQLYAAARETIRLNGLTNVLLYNAALDSHNGTESFICRTNAGKPLSSTSKLGDPRQPRHAMKVAVRTIDSIKADCDVIHLDIEGGEAKALEGAAETLKNRPALILETVPNGYEVIEKIELNSVCIYS